MPKINKTLTASQRAANPTLKGAFTNNSEASYSKVQNPEAQALPTEFDGNYTP